MTRLAVAALVVAIGLSAVACSNGGPTVAPGATSAAPGATSKSTSGPTAASTGGTTPATTGHSPKPSHSSAESPVPSESPVPVESNPPGDIPDSTQFVPYYSTAGAFEIKAPEGWSRRTTSSRVTFTSKLNTISAGWGPTSTQPTVAGVKKSEIRGLRSSFPAFELVSVKPVSLPGGPAIQVDFHTNSDPNPVTGKQYRLDVLRFDFFKGGQEASIDLSSPVGSDNVDAWKLISESFRWQ